MARLDPARALKRTSTAVGWDQQRGDVYLRCLLTHGARAVLHAVHRRATAAQPLTRLQQWALRVHVRRGHNKATIAVANKLGRVVWAVWHRDLPFADSCRRNGTQGAPGTRLWRRLLRVP